MRCQDAAALVFGVALVLTPYGTIADCGCQPPYQRAPYSGTYRVEIQVEELPHSERHTAINFAKDKWLLMLNSRGSGVARSQAAASTVYASS